mmetsp:Transcript_29403/g.38028  ORF Transcript_29403/g.38028 Transcript_29403/m.38028 type:complete len:307 (+) Transcript_29403:1-921(+)
MALASVFSILVTLHLIRFYTFRISGSRVSVAPAGEISKRRGRKKFFKPRSSDFSLIYNFFYQCAHLVLLIGEVSAIMMNFEFPKASFESAVVPLALYFSTVSQLEIGISWFQVYIWESRVNLNFFFKYMKTGVNVFVVAEAFILVLVFSFNPIHSSRFLIVGFFSSFAPLVCLSSGLFLSRKMIKLDKTCREMQQNYNGNIYCEAIRMRQTVKYMATLFFLLFFTALGVKKSIHSNPWGFVASFGLTNAFVLMHNIIFVKYVDRKSQGFALLNSIAKRFKKEPKQRKIAVYAGAYRFSSKFKHSTT